MRKAAFAIIFGFGLILIFGVYLSHTLFIMQRVAVVDLVEGEAEVLVRGTGDPVPLEVGELVRAGDLVQTGPGASVELRWTRWGGGTRIKVGPNTRFRVTRSIINTSTKSEESRLRVDEGRIWVRIRKALSGESKFEVETPTVVAAVRGTIFGVTVHGSGASHIEVLEGQVEVATAAGTSTILTGGSETDILPDQEALETSPLPPDDVAAWEAHTSMVGPFLVVESPADGVLIERASCAVSGRTEAGAQVFVNGDPVSVDDEHRFSVKVSLGEGMNYLVATARDAEGRETTVVHAVPRAAEPTAR